MVTDRLKILIVEDDEEKSAKWAKGALIKNPNVDLDTDQRVALAEQYFEIKWCKSKIQTEKELISKSFLPDLATLDIDLSDSVLDKNDEKLVENAKTSGLELIEPLKKFAPNCETIVFTAQLDKSVAVQEKVKQTASLTLFDNLHPKLQTFSAPKADGGEALSKQMPKLLRKVAEKFFLDLPVNEKTAIKKQIETDKDDDSILDYTVKSKNRAIKLRSLLMFTAESYWCKKTKKGDVRFVNIKAVLKELVNLNPVFETVGIWKEKVMLEAWEEYEKSDSHIKWQNEVEKRANELIEMFCKNESLKSVLSYNCKSHLNKSDTLTDNNEFRDKFLTALVARRVFIGLFHLRNNDLAAFENKRETELATEIYSFLKLKPIFLGDSFKTENYLLGLSGSYPSSVETNFPYIRLEEYNWLKKLNEQRRGNK